MSNFRSKLAEFLTSLEKNNYLDIKKNYIGNPVDKMVYEILTEHYKLSLSEKLFQFYNMMSSCKIEWTCDLDKHTDVQKLNADDTMINGQIYIRPLEEMLDFDKKLEADWWIKNLSREELEDFYNFRYFDFNDDYIRVGFIINKKRIITEKLYFIIQEADGFSPLGLTFDQYLEKIIEYKGFQGWQYNYFFQNSENHKRMMFYLSQLFR